MRLNIYYDLKYAPATFNFATFLVLGNIMRQKMGAELMGVNIVAEEYRKRTQRENVRPQFEMEFKVNHILSKLPFLIPEVDSVDVTTGPLTKTKSPSFPRGYPPSNLEGSEFIDSKWASHKIPYNDTYLHQFYGQEDVNLRPFKASEQAKFFIDNLFGDNVMAIHLRTSYNLASRNSNLDEWYKVYQELKRLKFRPIVIPDFEDCVMDRLFSKYDWEVFEPAAFDHDLRLALAEKAINNLMINAGSITTIAHSDCPYIIFKWVSETHLTTVENHKITKLLDYGDDLKWAAHNQHLIWEPDDADIILKTLDL
jgi:hypothetical protein